MEMCTLTEHTQFTNPDRLWGSPSLLSSGYWGVHLFCTEISYLQVTKSESINLDN